jgi:hypothetical protein
MDWGYRALVVEPKMFSDTNGTTTGNIDDSSTSFK